MMTIPTTKARSYQRPPSPDGGQDQRPFGLILPSDDGEEEEERGGDGPQSDGAVAPQVRRPVAAKKRERRMKPTVPTERTSEYDRELPS